MIIRFYRDEELALIETHRQKRAKVTFRFGADLTLPLGDHVAMVIPGMGSANLTAKPYQTALS